MWKEVGSVHSNHDKSIRSNRSREEVRFEPFFEQIKRHSNIEPQANRSFCNDYIQKRREDIRNLTQNSRSKSQSKSLKGDETARDDMFTSMRNVLSKEDPAISKLQSKKADENEINRNPQSGQERNDRIYKQALTRLRNLKKQQTKLKQTLNNEFNTFKNMLYQIQDKIHVEQQKEIEPVKPDSQIKGDPDFLRQILQQAVGIQQFFQEQDKRKAMIMERLSRQ